MRMLPASPAAPSSAKPSATVSREKLGMGRPGRPPVPLSYSTRMSWRRIERFSPDDSKTLPLDARNDQVRAFRIRPALCLDGGAPRLAGGRLWPPVRLAQAAVDCGGHGGRAFGGDGLQPADRRGYRCAQPAHQNAPPAGGTPLQRVYVGVRTSVRPSLPVCGLRVEPALSRTSAGGTGADSLLLLHQTVHLAFPSGAGPVPGNRAGGCLDRDAGLAGRANPAAHGSGDVLDRKSVV